MLVHRNVSRLAQESLNASGITLVLNVKMSVMERIARCTNADILTTVDAHVGTTNLGTCRSFYTKKFTLKDGNILFIIIILQNRRRFLSNFLKISYPQSLSNASHLNFI